MISLTNKVVIIDKDIIDNTIYEVVNMAYGHDMKTMYYIIVGRKSMCVNEHQIRLATQVEIDNGIKFDPIDVKTVVAYVDLLKPNHLLEVVEYDEATLAIKAIQYYTKEYFSLHVDDVRPARIKERELGQRVTIYNKDLYLSYFNPFMVYDLYNSINAQDIIYHSTLTKLGILEHSRLTANGERLLNDIDFEYLKQYIYDRTTINQETTYVATDRDGTVTEFKTLPNSMPMFDDINGKWYIIETNDEYVISTNKVIGMMKNDQYENSLLYVGNS